jgi:hypothetical protein
MKFIQEHRIQFFHLSFDRIIIIYPAQDDDSDLRNRPESSGKRKQYFRSEDCRIIPAISHRKNPEIFRSGILLPWNRRNSPEPTVPLPYCPTREVDKFDRLNRKVCILSNTTTTGYFSNNFWWKQDKELRFSLFERGHEDALNFILESFMICLLWDS